MNLSDYVTGLPLLAEAGVAEPWVLCTDAATAITMMLSRLDDAYHVDNGIAVHETATIEPSMTLKPPCIVGPHWLRRVVLLSARRCLSRGGRDGRAGRRDRIVLHRRETSLAHLNFIGNSLIGSNVNIEAGAVIANHRNEREDKSIRIALDGRVITVSRHEIRGSDRRSLPDRRECRPPARNDTKTRDRRRSA